MVRAVILKFNGRLALSHNFLHNNTEPLGPEQSPTNHIYVLRYLFSSYSALLSSIEVNSTWIFIRISKRFISFA